MIELDEPITPEFKEQIIETMKIIYACDIAQDKVKLLLKEIVDITPRQLWGYLGTRDSEYLLYSIFDELGFDYYFSMFNDTLKFDKRCVIREEYLTKELIERRPEVTNHFDCVYWDNSMINLDKIVEAIPLIVMRNKEECP